VRHDLEPTDPGFGKLAPCPNHWHTDERHRELTRRCGLKEHELGYTLEKLASFNDVTDQLATTMQAFMDDSKGWLYLWGGPGNGGRRE
jgi:hypothetical protein